MACYHWVTVNILRQIPLQGIPVLFIPGNRGSYKQGVCVRTCVCVCACVRVCLYRIILVLVY